MDADRDLTLMQLITCGAYWRPNDAQGNLSNKVIHCNWVGVVREGVVHNPQCPCSKLEVAHDYTNCRCGGMVSDSIKSQEEAQQASLSTT